MPTRRATEKETTIPLPDDGPNYEDVKDPDPVAPPDVPVMTRLGNHAMIGHHQQRAMAVALKRHGITTDAAVYDYLTTWTGREITSRKELTTIEAARIIRELDMTAPTTPADVWEALAAPFPPDQIEKLPKPLSRDAQRGNCRECGGYHGLPAVHLDYVGHAGITMRLNEVVTPAGWSWEPVSFGPDGLPAVGREFWIRLTIAGVTKYGVGDDYGTSAKQAIGDALRNAAMRFGIGTYLWSKSEAALEMKRATDDHEPIPEPSNERPTLDADLLDKGTADLLMMVGDYADRANKTFTDYTEAWRKTFSPPLSVPDLDDLPAETVAAAIMGIRAHMGGAS